MPSNIVGLFVDAVVDEPHPFRPIYLVNDFGAEHPAPADVVLVEVVMTVGDADRVVPMIAFLADASADQLTPPAVVDIFTGAVLQRREQTEFLQPFTVEDDFDYQLGGTPKRPTYFKPGSGVVLLEGSLTRDCASKLLRELAVMGAVPAAIALAS